MFLELVPTTALPSAPPFSALPSIVRLTFWLIIEEVMTQELAPVSNKKSNVSELFIFPFIWIRLSFPSVKGIVSVTWFVFF